MKGRLIMKKRFKKFAALVCAAAISVSAISCFSVSAASVNYGDVNADGVVDIRDVSVIQKVLADLADAPDNFSKTANVLSDSTVDIRDVTTLQTYIVGKYTSIPISPDGWYNQIIKP